MGGASIDPPVVIGFCLGRRLLSKNNNNWSMPSEQPGLDSL
jgi:hypothetical protein